MEGTRSGRRVPRRYSKCLEALQDATAAAGSLGPRNANRRLRLGNRYGLAKAFRRHWP